jgi:hypothetical protein
MATIHQVKPVFCPGCGATVGRIAHQDQLPLVDVPHAKPAAKYLSIGLDTLAVHVCGAKAAGPGGPQ